MKYVLNSFSGSGILATTRMRLFEPDSELKKHGSWLIPWIFVFITRRCLEVDKSIFAERLNTVRPPSMGRL